MGATGLDEVGELIRPFVFSSLCIRQYFLRRKDDSDTLALLSMELSLTDDEMAMAGWVGEERYRYARQTGRNPGLGPSSVTHNPELHIRGAECEYAASLMLNLSWRPTVGQLDALDVGGICNVRSAIVPDHRLIVKPTDPDWVPFVLVIKQDRHFRLAGWIYAIDAKKFPLLSGYGDPAHFVSQKDLRAIEPYTPLLWNAPLLWNELRRAIVTEFRK